MEDRFAIPDLGTPPGSSGKFFPHYRESFEPNREFLARNTGIYDPCFPTRIDLVPSLSTYDKVASMRRRGSCFTNLTTLT